MTGDNAHVWVDGSQSKVTGIKNMANHGFTPFSNNSITSTV